MGIIAIKTILLGIVEGLTEFIPVSSTAHLLVTGKLLVMNQNLLEVLSISIQSGAILAAVWYFWRTIWSNLSLIPKVALAFLPTALIGLTLYPLIKSALDSTTTIALALIVGGIALMLIRPNDKAINIEDIARISYAQAFLIGLVQTLSFIPGVSRAGATLIGGSLLRIPRVTIVAFSFLLGIPTILGASVVEARHNIPLITSTWTLVLLGTIVAFVVALATMRFFIKLLTTKPLSWFGWYRIALGILVLIIFF